MKDQTQLDSLNEDAKKSHDIFVDRMNTIEDSGDLLLKGPMSAEEIRKQVKDYQEAYKKSVNK